MTTITTSSEIKTGILKAIKSLAQRIPMLPTPPNPNLLDRLYAQLDQARLTLLRAQLPALLDDSIQLHLSGFDRTLIIICNRSNIPTLESHLEALKFQARHTTLSESISLYVQNEQIWTVSSRLAEPLQTTSDMLNEYLLKDSTEQDHFIKQKQPEMPQTLSPTTTTNSATATPTSSTTAAARHRKANQTKAIAKPTSTPSTTPDFSAQIRALAKSTGVNPETIAMELLATLPTEMVEHGMETLVDRRVEAELAALKANRRNELLGISSIATPASSTDKPKTPKTSKATAKADATAKASAKPDKPKASSTEAKPMRFKKFVVSSRGVPTTLGSFLKAQGWDAAQQQDVLQAMAALPEAIADASSLPEQIIARILKDTKGGKTSRKDVINAASKKLQEPTPAS